MALSLVLLEYMQDNTHANVLKEEFLRSLLQALRNQAVMAFKQST